MSRLFSVRIAAFIQAVLVMLLAVSKRIRSLLPSKKYSAVYYDVIHGIQEELTFHELG